MGMIMNIRAPLPVGEPLVSAAPAGLRRSPPTDAASAAPVAAPVLHQAVQLAQARPPASDTSLLEARMTAETHAAAAAEAAREAYIKASIAAGINPLPVP